MASDLPDVPGYVLTHLLGQGTFGVVFAAHSLAAPQRALAIKIFKRDVVVRTKDVLRVQREGRIGFELRHANIVEVHEIGEIDGRHFIVMDRVEGEQLRDRILRRFPEGDARLAEDPGALARELRIVARVCRAAGHAHRCNIIHRDIKPANILVRSDGHPFLIDFGLGRHLDGESTLTSTGVTVGSYYYMAPEQLDADAARIGPASDIYALGATLHHVCTGRVPFTATNANELRRRVFEEEVPPAPPGLPAGLERIWLRALEKQPQHRYRSAEEMADDLERVADGLSPRGRGTPLAVLRGWRSIVRERRVLVASMLAALIALSAVFAWRAHGKESVEMQRLYLEGDLALLRDDLNGALECYRGSARLGPDDAEPLLRMAAACASFELRDKAQEFIATARKLGFNVNSGELATARELYCRALFRVWSNDIGGAESDFQAALRRDPDFHACHLALSRIAQRGGDLRAAETHLEKYQSFLAEHYPSWKVVQAQVLELRGHFDGALELLRPLEPDTVSDALGAFRVHSTRGRLLSRLARWPDAVVELERAVACNDRDSATLANLGLALFRQGRPDAALSSAKRALAIDPGCTTAHAVAAWIAAQRGANAEAEQHLCAASPELSAASAARLREGADVFEASERARDAGSEQEAVELCRRALSLDPEHLGALLELAQDEAVANHFAAAADLYRRAEVVADRFGRPLSLGRDLWSAQYYTERHLLVLAQGQFWTSSRLGDEAGAARACNRVLELFEHATSLELDDVVNYADAVAQCPFENLRDWCAAKRWLQSNKVIRPLELDAEIASLIELCTSRCP